jgi:diacylglycerol kinase family enzyme
MKVTAIINAGAGSVTGSDKEPLQTSLGSAFAKHGIEAELALVKGPEIKETAERAREGVQQRKIDAVVVGGGDGTVRTVAGVLAGTGVPLGVLPLGTLNHFAKDLGIPEKLEDAVALIAAGHTRRVDLGEVNGEIFINNSSLGIYPYLVSDRERQTSATGRTKWVAASFAFLRVLRRFPTRRLTLELGGGAAPVRTPCLFIGNNEYQLTPLALGQRVTMDGGELWLCIAQQKNPLRLVWLALRLIIGLADPAKELATAHVTAAEIRSGASRVPVAMDGEVIVLRPPLLYRCHPGDLIVFAPQQAPPH